LRKTKTKQKLTFCDKSFRLRCSFSPVLEDVALSTQFSVHITQLLLQRQREFSTLNYSLAMRKLKVATSIDVDGLRHVGGCINCNK
jgi:hypothetical protein